jgi:hypothetical protein
LDWQRNHPLLRFVNFDTVTLGTTREVIGSAGLVPLVQSDVGPLVLAGERNGTRTVALAFDPYATDLPLGVGWPIFVLNTVGWLTESNGGAGEGRLVQTGQPWLRPLSAGAIERAVVNGPEGRYELPVTDGVIRLLNTQQVGVYSVRAGGLEAQFAANLLSERESRIAPHPSLDLGQASGAVNEASVVGGRRELWRTLLLFGLAFIVVEWWAWNRRKST